MSAGRASPGQQEGCPGQAPAIPTPVTRTQARGGCSAAAMALAKLLVVSTRLLMISWQKASPHLGKGEAGIKHLTGTPQETRPPRGPQPTPAPQAQERPQELPSPQGKGRTAHLTTQVQGNLGTWWLFFSLKRFWGLDCLWTKSAKELDTKAGVPPTSHTLVLILHYQM